PFAGSFTTAGFIILDHPLRSDRRSDRRFGLVLDVPWKLDRETTSFVELAVHRDGAFVLGDDSIHHRQPEAQSFADFFRGEERFEDPPARVWFHAHAII